MELIRDTRTADRKNRNQTIREWATYFVICSFLTLLNWATSPHTWWVIWVIAGWGLNLLLRLIFRKFDLDSDE